MANLVVIDSRKKLNLGLNKRNSTANPVWNILECSLEIRNTSKVDHLLYTLKGAEVISDQTITNVRCDVFKCSKDFLIHVRSECPRFHQSFWPGFLSLIQN